MLGFRPSGHAYHVTLSGARQLQLPADSRPVQMVESIAPATIQPPAPPRARFVINVLWNWLGVVVNVAVGLLLSPYIVRTLGEERYGIWALMFGLLDYIWFLDMGLNTAVVNFVARFGARRETDEINRVVNTALAYFSGVSL